MRFLILVPLFTVLMGCSRPSTQDTQTAPQAADVAAPEAVAQTDPNEVLATVNGKTLTRGEAETEVGYRLGSARTRVPPERYEALKQYMLASFIDQFVARTLLLEEVDKAGIAISEEDEKLAFEKLRENLPPGTTLEDIMERSPLGADRMREEVLTGLKINQLLSMRITNQFDMTEEELNGFIEQNKEELTLPENVHARHILLTIGPDTTEEEKAAKRLRTEGLRQQILDGADFAEVATEYSECPSKANGGDLGTFGRGQMVGPFEDAAFSQEIDEVGPVVETQFGYHIVQVLEKKPGGLMPQDEIRRKLSEEQQQAAVMDYINVLRENADITLNVPSPM